MIMLFSRILSMSLMFVLFLFIASASAAPTGTSPSTLREGVHLLSKHDLAASTPRVTVAVLEGAAAAHASLSDLPVIHEGTHRFERAPESAVQRLALYRLW
jgi:hypothetical protein